jgi:hypothetical protein
MRMRTLIRLALGAATLAAASSTQYFWELVDRGQAVRPNDGSAAGTIDRTLTVDLPAAAGAALGTVVSGILQAVEQARGSVAAGEAPLERGSPTLLGRAGLPTRAGLDEIRRRLDRIAAIIDDLSR